MEVRYLGFEHDNINTEQGICPLALKTIGGIQFTSRELDIIACVLGGRASKKIGSFLSIAPKTVENHIHNIMLKLGCSSRDNIIDFIEKSEKFALIKKHYSNLLIQAVFEQELKKISSTVTYKTPTCLIAYPKEQKENEDLIFQLEKHLKLAGINTQVELQEKYDERLQLVDKIESQHINIVYILPGKFSNQLQIEQSALKGDASGLIEDNKNINSVIYLSLNNEISNFEKIACDSERIKLSGRKDYFLLFTELLKIILPIDAINKNISEFIRQYEILRGHSVQVETQGKTAPPKENIKEALPIPLKNSKKIISLGIILFLTFFCVLSLNFNRNKNQEIIASQANPSVSMNKPISLLEEGGTGQSMVWNLPRQDNLFVGRKELLKTLHVQLQPISKKDGKNKSYIPLAIAVCKGLGGIGKTQLALKYVNKYKNDYALCAWFSAEHVETLQQDYMSFANALGYSEAKPSVMAAQRYVNDYLTKHPGWLLVFDNATHYDVIKPFLPERGGSVLITSQYQYWPQTTKELSIGIMEEADAINLVKKITKKDDTEIKDIKKLVGALGGFPLALDHASAFIWHRNLSVAEYLNRYKNNQETMLTDQTSPVGVKHNPVAVTFCTSLAAIEAENTTETPSLPSMLLLVCAYLFPERIPTDALVAWVKIAYPSLKEPQLLVDKALIQLQAYSLITIHGDNTLSLHCLVQEVIRGYHQQGSLSNIKVKYPTLTLEWYEKLLESLHVEFWRKTKVLENEARQSRLAPHLQSVVNHYKALWPSFLSKPHLAHLLHDIGDEYYKKGLYRDAKDYWEKALAIFEKQYGPEHTEVATTLNDLGISIRYLGDSVKAKLYHERALSIFEKHYGPEHAEIARTLNHLGTAIRDLGDATAAKVLYERALAIDEKHYGSEHVEVARTLGNVASAIRYMGDTGRAKFYHERALSIFEKHYGPDHVEVARTLNNLGTTIRELGDPATAKVLYERALAIDEKHYGREHVEVARTLGNVANAIRELGDADMAKKLYERALPINEKHYGSDHVEVARTLNNLGTAVRYLGDFKTAKLYHERALPINVKHYGPEHVEVARTINNLGVIFRELGDAATARKMHERALAIQEKHYGKEHVQVTETLNDLAHAVKDLGYVVQSKEILERVVSIRKNFYGPDHVEVAKVLVDLAGIHHGLKDVPKMQTLGLEAYIIFKRHLGKSHSYTQQALKYVETMVKYKHYLQNVLEIHEKAEN